MGMTSVKLPSTGDKVNFEIFVGIDVVAVQCVDTALVIN